MPFQALVTSISVIVLACVNKVWFVYHFVVSNHLVDNLYVHRSSWITCVEQCYIVYVVYQLVALFFFNCFDGKFEIMMVLRV